MVSPKHLNNAPISEALIDIRTNIDPNRLGDLESIHDHVKENYPSKQTRNLLEGTIEGKGDTLTHRTKGTVIEGYWFLTPDEKQIFQARLDGFTFNKIEPYDSWDQLSEEAITLWQIYKKFAQPTTVNRIGLRYINRIKVPALEFSLSDYLVYPPGLATELEYVIDGFLTEITFFDHKIESRGVLRLKMEPPTPEEETPILVDIEVFKDKNIDVEHNEEIWYTAESLRNFKNKIFFNSITEKTEELCQ